jgi:hypothetical protein
MKDKTERCYVVHGTGFSPLKIKGMQERNNLMKTLKLKGYKPKFTGLSCKSKSGKTCKRIPTKY